jgi:hypothetical protein
MLAQDPVTGQVYEVPDSQLYEADYAEYPEMMGEPPVVFDGFGNPIGTVGLPFLPMAISAAGGLIRRIIQAVRQRRAMRAAQGAPAPMPAPMPAAPMPMMAPFVAMPPQEPVAMETMGEAVYDGLGNPVGLIPPFPLPAPVPAPFRLSPFMPQAFRPRQLQVPPGWVRPPVPFLGMRPRRLYLRCSAWRGPAGLVPGFATQPVAPSAAAPGGAPVPVRRRHRRR